MSSKPGILLLLTGTYALMLGGLSLVPLPSVHTSHSTVEEHVVQIRGRREQAGLPNLYQLHDRLYAGGRPDGLTAFQSLAALGVHTVISVDGAEPDVAAAVQAGLRYVHLPIGYDGIPRSRLVELSVAAQQLPGKIYLHCHQGLHRGPAAAVAVCQMEGTLAPGVASQLMQEMGTAPKYLGLYRDAESAAPATLTETKSVIVAKLPERVAVPPLTHQMVELNHAFEHWSKHAKTADAWTPPLQAEATQLAELLTEAGRRLDGTPPREELRQRLLSDGEWLMTAAEGTTESPALLTKAIRLRCDDCHARFRDHEAAANR